MRFYVDVDGGKVTQVKFGGKNSALSLNNWFRSNIRALGGAESDGDAR